MRTDRIPGVAKESEVALLRIISDLQKRLDALEKKPTSPAIVTSDYQARESQYVRVAAPAAGLNLTLPQASPSNRGNEITLSFETENPVYLRAVNGQVNRKSYVVTSQIGTFKAISDGEMGWAVALGLSTSGSAIDATYFLQTAHASLPNARIGINGIGTTVDYSTGGFVSWNWNGFVVRALVGDDIEIQYGRHNLRFVNSTSIQWDLEDDPDNDEVEVIAIRSGLNGVITAGDDVNTTTFTTVGAKRVLVNATNGVASPAFLAATAAYQYLRDNATNTGLEWATLAAHASTSVLYSSDTWQRAALTGSVEAAQNANATTFGSVAAGDSLAVQNASQALGYIGSTSTINMTPVSGSLGVVNISTLKCGGLLTFQNLTEATIDGFTAPASDGFWFVLHIRDTTTSDSVTILENSGNTTTSVRTPDLRDWRLTKNDTVLLLYGSTRWRIVATLPKLWIPTADSVTWAAQQDNYTRTSRGVANLRATLTGSQTLTGVVPDGITSNGELLAIQNIDTVDTLTIAHESTSSTAANRFTLPSGQPLILEPRSGALFIYDASTGRWRLLSAVNVGQGLTETTAQTVTNGTTSLTAGTLTAPANSLYVGAEYQLDAWLYAGRGVTLAARDVIVELLVAGVLIRTNTIAINAIATNDGIGFARGRITCRTTGASGTALISLETGSDFAALAAAKGPWTWTRDPAPSATSPTTTTVDTTVDNTIQLRARLSGATATVYLHVTHSTITKVR